MLAESYLWLAKLLALLSTKAMLKDTSLRMLRLGIWSFGVSLSFVFFGCDHPKQEKNTDMPNFRFQRIEISDVEGWKRIEPNARGVHSAYVRRQLIRLFDGDYHLLEEEARQQRLPVSPKQIGLSGKELWLYSFFYYDWNANPEWDRFFTSISDWQSEFPESNYPKLAQAAGLISYAYAELGDRNLRMVLPRTRNAFYTRLQEAQSILNQIGELKPEDHSLKAFLLIRIAKGLGESRESTQGLVAESIAQYPQYPLVYREFIDYLSPRSHGRQGDWQLWFHEQVTNSHWGESGMSPVFYVQILWPVYREIRNSEGLFFNSPHLDWEKAQKGLEILRAEEHPDIPFWSTVSVALAFGTGEKENVRSALDDLPGEFDSWVIGYRFWEGVLNSAHSD